MPVTSKHSPIARLREVLAREGLPPEKIAKIVEEKRTKWFNEVDGVTLALAHDSAEGMYEDASPHFEADRWREQYPDMTALWNKARASLNRPVCRDNIVAGPVDPDEFGFAALNKVWHVAADGQAVVKPITRSLGEYAASYLIKEREGFKGEPLWSHARVPGVLTKEQPRKVFPGTLRALVNPVMDTGPLVCGSTDCIGGWREEGYKDRVEWARQRGYHWRKD